jgi:predicted secreted acid phosphatase
MRGLIRLLLLVAVLVVAGCCSTPPHLDDAKRAVVAYYEGGAYAAEVARVAAAAHRQIERSGPHKFSVIVLDVDDTAISTWAYQRSVGLGYHRATLEAWRAAAEAPALEPILELTRYAQQQGVGVVFLTGRREKLRASTEETLRRAGYTWRELIMKPDDYQGSTADFKREARRRLSGPPTRIVANLGDQESDLAGGYAERHFKLPNLVYRVD